MKKTETSKWRSLVFMGMLLLGFMLTGCGNTKTAGSGTGGGAKQSEITASIGDASAGDAIVNTAEETENGAPEIPGLTYLSTMELSYAECFDVYFYQDDYAVIDVHDSARYLVVPEEKDVPADLPEDMVVLQQPLNRIYLAATSAMALFDALDSIDHIRLSGTQASGWYVEDAVTAMEAGDILFAGKYSEPDYELLVNEDCNLAIESTMILHAPKVQEMIEMLDIPVFIDRSSYESHPLGRTEWIKLYGVLMGKEEEAEAFFQQQAEIIDELKDFENTEKKVVYFYVNTSGAVVVKSASDYIPRMIEIAGGRYVFDDLVDEDGGQTSIAISMEEFYAKAVDADYLIYNGTIDNPIESTEELLAKSELFQDFRAVQEGNVWTTGKDLYQATDIVGRMIKDLNLMLTDGDPSEMTFLKKID
jgi:iron complex transport system substrate-binding protein